jgi:hypothetical protein
MHEMEQAANDLDIASCSSCGTKTYDLVGSLIDPSADICMGCAKREDMQMQGSRKQAGRKATAGYVSAGGIEYEWDYDYDQDSYGEPSLVVMLRDKGNIVDSLGGIEVRSLQISDHGNVNINPQDEQYLKSIAQEMADGMTSTASKTAAEVSRTASGGVNYNGQDYVMGMTGADATCIVCNTHFPGGAEGFVKPGEGGTEGATFVCRWDAQDIQAQGSKQAAFRKRVQANLRTAAYEDDFDSAGDAYVYEDQDGRKFTDRDIEEVKLMARDYEAWSNL